MAGSMAQSSAARQGACSTSGRPPCCPLAAPRAQRQCFVLQGDVSSISAAFRSDCHPPLTGSPCSHAPAISGQPAFHWHIPAVSYVFVLLR